ncbi:hypothetical protein AO390_07490 [Pseudomonas marginalis ICMP 11289]|nr:hypothetical protein AO390_07490 [Pseudomonas marginalis ICMP 11289]
MPARIIPVDRIPGAVGVGIQTTLAKWAQLVRPVEAHQHRVIGTITVTQQIMAGYRVRLFAIETGKMIQRRSMTMGAIRNGLLLRG